MKWVCIRENLKDFKTHFSSAIISMSLRNLVNMYININIHIKIYKYYIYMYIYIYICVCVCVCVSLYIYVFIYMICEQRQQGFLYIIILEWMFYVGVSLSIYSMPPLKIHHTTWQCCKLNILWSLRDFSSYWKLYK